MNFKAPLQFFKPSIMISKKQFTAFTCSALVLASSAVLAEDKIIVSVNGYDITESQYKIAAIQNNIDPKEITAEQNKLLLSALINRQLVLDEAIKAKFDQDPEIISHIKALIDSYVATNYLATIAEKLTSSEEELKSYYDKEVVAKAPKEFKARHILVKTEQEAKDIIAELGANVDFATLAKQKSLDSGSGINGGDLGWFTKQDMVASFSQAVINMKKGELNKTPIKSEFGWHVIILDDERSSKVPEFKAVKDNIDKLLIKLKLTLYMQELNGSAKIQMK